MRQPILYIIIAAIAYFIIAGIVKTSKAVKYLKEVGIPDDIINKMSAREIRAAANYLYRYGKTNIHFAVGDDDYNILSEIRTKYGIFT